MTYRRYGRKNTVERGPRTRAAVRTVMMQLGLASPYLIASCERDGFLLNLDMWAEDDLSQIASALDISTVVPPEAPTTVDQVRDEFPGAMSFHLAHPNWTAIIVLLVAVPVVAAVMWAFGSWTEDDVDHHTSQREPTATRVPELPSEAAAAQDALLAETQQVFGRGTRWEHDVSTADCADAAGWQKIVEARSEDGSSQVDGTDPRTALEDVARKAGMSSDGLDADGSFELDAQDARTGAFLQVRGGDTDGPDLSISAGSVCVSK